ncbi:peptide deformylase [Patescibacteria group bacterium]|nr:peptide deformylase [Patescibacteria group bacterium]
MIINKLRQIGDPVLYKKAEKISSFKGQVLTIIENLKDSLREHDLIGLAAPQIGKGVRVFVTEIYETEARKGEETDELRVYVNPKIVWRSKKEVEMWEGCGSVVDGKLFGPVVRPKEVVVQALNETGKEFELKTDGLLSRVIQHEFDHLEGDIFIKKVVDPERLMEKDEYLNRIVKK